MLPPPARLDLVKQALAFPRAQDRELTNFDAFLEGIGAGAQMVEDDTQALALSSTLASATGRLLDTWGEMVGEPREGLDDNAYRRFIRARGMLHLSQGRATDLYAVWCALWLVDGRAGRVAEMNNHAPRLFELIAWLPSAPPVQEQRRAARLMREGTPIGMNLHLVLVAGSRWFGYADHDEHEHSAALGYDAGSMGWSI
jgi:hypothetical protein